jgi:hypothetical protein
MTINGTRRGFAGLVVLAAVTFGAVAPALQHGGAVARADQQPASTSAAQPWDSSQGTPAGALPCQGPDADNNPACCPGANNTNWG